MTPLTLIGQIDLIKREHQLEKALAVEFILTNKDENQRDQFFFLKAYSPGNYDRFGISNLIGREVSIECTVTGRKSEGAKGTFYTNELRVKTIRTV